MPTVRTYGVSPETLEKLSDSVYLNMVERISGVLSKEKNDDLKEILDTLVNRPLSSKSLIVASLIYGIGNFDRIVKIELDAKLNDEGTLENPKERTKEYIS